MKIFRKGFVILLMTLTILVVLTAALAGDPLFAGALRAYGPPAIGQPLEFDDAGLSILGGSAHIDGLEVGAPSEPLAEIASFRFDADALALLGGRIAIEEAALGKTHLRLIINEDGKLGFDPGPPPPDAEPDPGSKPPVKEEERTPPEDRDLVEIVEELWERYETYKEYYDEYGGVFGGGEEQAEEVAKSRAKWPGKPDYLSAGEGQTAAEAGVFWLEKAEIADFSWETLDKRTGKAVLPAISSGTIRLLNLGAPPLGEDGTVTTPTSVIDVAAVFADKGGNMLMTLNLPRDGGFNGLSLQLTELPIDSLRHAVHGSLPYELAGGVFDLAGDAEFLGQELRGELRLQLRGAQLKPKAGSPVVLGVNPAEFCSVLNRALGSQPVEFVFGLGGSPTDPSFELKDATDLDDLILEAVVDEAEARLRAEAEEKKQELENRAKEEIGDKANELLGDKANELLGDKAKKGLGGLLGGKKKGDGG